jgi:hypothetical protein
MKTVNREQDRPPFTQAHAGEWACQISRSRVVPATGPHRDGFNMKKVKRGTSPRASRTSLMMR